MARSKRKVDSALLAKGFQPRGGDHDFFIYWSSTGRKTTVQTKTSHGPGGSDIGDKLLSQMAKQCRLPRATFLELVDCPLSREEYEAMLCQQGELDTSEIVPPRAPEDSGSPMT